MYTSGVELPELFTVQDQILQEFMARQELQESRKARLWALTAAGLTDKEKVSNHIFNDVLKPYIETEMNLEQERQQEQREFDKDFSKIRDLRPTLEKGENGLVLKSLF